MRNRHVRLAVLAALSSASALAGYDAAAGEIVVDGSLPGTQFGALDPVNGTYNIGQNLGLLTRDGSNLFHSFEVFNLDAGDTAIFSGNATIANIISRVTGEDPTTINGTIRSTINGANFWFVNPNGLTVGPSGVIDVSGAIALGAANYIEFANGARFMALPDGDEVGLSLLMSAPVDFGFLEGAFAGELRIESSDLLTRTARVSPQQIQPLDGSGSFSMLLAGGSGVFLETEGNIELHDARIRTGSDFVAGNIEMRAGGSINLSGSDLLTSAAVDGFGGGDIFIRGGELVSISGSSIVAQSIDAFAPTGSITISGSGVLINDYSQVALDFRASDGGIEGIGAGTISIGTTSFSDEIAPETNLTTATEGVVRIVDATISASSAGSQSFADGGIAVGTAFPDTPDGDTLELGATHVIIAGSTLAADATDGGFAGDISVAAEDGVWIVDSNNGSSALTARASDTAVEAGVVSVFAGDAGITIRNANLDISTSAPSADPDGGRSLASIDLNASGMVRVEGSVLRTDADNGFAAGNIGVSGGALHIEGSTLTASSSVDDPSQRSTGDSNFDASIFLMAGLSGEETDVFSGTAGDPLAGSVTILNSTIRANATNNGSPLSDPIGSNAGAIEVLTDFGSITIANSTLESAASGPNSGAAGLVSLTGGSIDITGSTINVAGESLNPDVEDAADDDRSQAIELTALGDLRIANSTLTASTSGVAVGGDIFALTNSIDIQNSTLQSSTTGTGSAGAIILLAFPVVADLAAPDEPSEPLPLPDFGPSFIRITDSTLATSTGTTPSSAGSISLFAEGRIDVTRSSLNVSVTADPNAQPSIPTGPDLPSGLPTPVSFAGIDFFSNGAPITVVDSTLQANTTGVIDGGAIFLEGGSFLIRNSSITASSSAPNGTVIDPSMLPGDAPRASAGAITITFAEDSLRDFGDTDTDTDTDGLNVAFDIEKSVIATNALATDGGDIEISGFDALSLRDSMVLASAGGVGLGGDIAIEGFTFDAANSQVLSVAETGLGGNIGILTTATNIQDSRIATSATAANGGNITIDTFGEMLRLQGSSVVASAGGSGVGGDIGLTSLGAGSIVQNSQIQALAESGGGGTISLEVMAGIGGTLQILDSQVAANAAAANGGDIAIDAGGARLEVARSNIVASAGGSGVGGDISIIDADGVMLTRSQVQALASAGSGGTINVALAAGASGPLQIDASSITTNADLANGGNITLDAAGNQVLLRGSSVVASAGGSGTGGSISIVNAGAALLQDSQVQALADAGSGGTINLDLIDASSGPVSLTNSSIRTNALNSSGGNITLDASGQRVSLQNSDIVASAGGTGTGGGITISNAAGTALQGSRIQALAAAGAGGTINITQAAGVGGGVTLDSSSIMTNATAANGGNITLNAAGKAVTLNDSMIVASAGGNGVGGGISITNAAAATLTGSQVQALADAGAGGTINIGLTSGSSGALVLDNSSITTNANNANAGSIMLNAAGNAVTLDDSMIVASAGGNGVGGGISIINAGAATLTGSQVQALANAGAGGTINIGLTAGSSGALVLDNSSITTNAANANGGNITLDAAGHQVALRRASIVASAGGNGAGGDIAILNARGASLQDTQIQALANAGAGGTINIAVQEGSGPVLIQRSNITTNAVAAGGGNITLDAGGNQVLLRDSTILASAGATGTGGNILIDNLGRTIVQRSQILARADAGNGGTITLNLTPGALFLRDAQSTISADSNSGNDGLVAINSPDTDLNPAVKLQDAALGDTPELSANGCVPATNAARSTFVRDSRGGVSPSPDNYLLSMQSVVAPQASAATPLARPAVEEGVQRVALVGTPADAQGCK